MTYMPTKPKGAPPEVEPLTAPIGYREWWRDPPRYYEVWPLPYRPRVYRPVKDTQAIAALRPEDV